MEDWEIESILEIKKLKYQIPRLERFLQEAHGILMRASSIIEEFEGDVHPLVDERDLQDGENDIWAITYGEAFVNAMRARIEQLEEDLPDDYEQQYKEST